MPEATVQKTETRTSHSGGVTATAKIEAVQLPAGLELNPRYFIGIPGIIKLIQLLFGIICMGCASPAIYGYVHFFLFVVVISFIVTLLLCFGYLFSIKKAITVPEVKCTFFELIFTAVATVFYFIAAVVQLAMTAQNRRQVYTIYGNIVNTYYDSYIAAGVFAVFNLLAYAAGALFLFQDWRNQRQPTQPAH